MYLQVLCIRRACVWGKKQMTDLVKEVVGFEIVVQQKGFTDDVFEK